MFVIDKFHGATHGGKVRLGKKIDLLPLTVKKKKPVNESSIRDHLLKCNILNKKVFTQTESKAFNEDLSTDFKGKH